MIFKEEKPEINPPKKKTHFFLVVFPITKTPQIVEISLKILFLKKLIKINK